MSPVSGTLSPAPTSVGAGGWRGAVAPLLTLVGALGTCVFVAAADPTTPGGISPPCPTKALFGIVCPGCGSARMLYSLVHGDLRSALTFNAVGVAMLVLLVWSYIAWSTRRITGRSVPRWETLRWAPLAIGALAAVWLIVRNLPFAPFDSLAV